MMLSQCLIKPISIIISWLFWYFYFCKFNFYPSLVIGNMQYMKYSIQMTNIIGADKEDAVIHGVIALLT